MKHSPETLLLAARVLELAHTLATQKRRDEHEQWSKARRHAGRPPIEDSNAKHAELAAKYPADDFIQAAVHRLETVADRIITTTS